MKNTRSLQALLEDGKAIVKNEELKSFYRAKDLYESLNDCRMKCMEFDLKNGKTLIELELD